MSEHLNVRRDLLADHVLPKLDDPVRRSPELNASLADVINAVRSQGLEGVVAKRLDSAYEPGQRSGAWRKMRINQGQEFVIGGYTLGAKHFDALVFGYYEDGKLLYAARNTQWLHASFEGGTTEEILADSNIDQCPFVNLPEARSGRWGQGLTAEKMTVCRLVETGAGRTV